MSDQSATASNESTGPIARRIQFSTELRAAIWEAHNKRCPYTGDHIRFAELEIDHIVPITIAREELTRLVDEGVVPADFDLNGLANLLPTKGFQNGLKGALVRPNNVLIHFLNIAEMHRASIEATTAAEINHRKLLKAFLQLNALADRNSLNVDEVIDIFRQEVGIIRTRHVPELDSVDDITLFNAELARELMVKPFALGGGGITEVVVQDEADNQILCTNCAEFVAAKADGLWPLSQFDINCYSMAEMNCAMLVALEQARFASESALRYPRVNCRNLDRWSSAWIKQVWIDVEEPDDVGLFERCKTISNLLAEGACQIVEQQDWHFAVEPRNGLAVAISELFRADLDGDGAEEILVFELTYAPEGTLRAGRVRIAKPDGEGILQPVADETP